MKYPFYVVSLIFALGSCSKKELSAPVNNNVGAVPKDSTTKVPFVFHPYVDIFQGHFITDNDDGMWDVQHTYDSASFYVRHITPDSIIMDAVYSKENVNVFSFNLRYKIVDSARYHFGYSGYFIIGQDSLNHFEDHSGGCLSYSYTSFAGRRIPQIVQ